jgi:hypothetical protein
MYAAEVFLPEIDNEVILDRMPHRIDLRASEMRRSGTAIRSTGRFSTRIEWKDGAADDPCQRNV